MVQVELTAADRQLAADSWRQTMAALYERRSGPRKLALEPTLAPYSHVNSVLPGRKSGAGAWSICSQRRRSWPAARERCRHRIRQCDATISLDSVAQAHVNALDGDLSSPHRAVRSQTALRDYLEREHAIAQAKQADAEIAAGKYRGALHGIPWGGKDLLDTAGIPTTYGAEPYRHRVPEHDAAVVTRLKDAGAVLIAKLSLGALALNDIWFRGQTMNPWLLEEGSSGSSAGPGAATAAGLVGFAIGSETGGSIVSPSCAAELPDCGRRMAECRARAQ